jgi:hypothetical protein
MQTHSRLRVKESKEQDGSKVDTLIYLQMFTDSQGSDDRLAYCRLDGHAAILG